MTPDFDKSNGLIPVIVQDAKTDKVLMLGYQNEEAFNQTKETGKVTFFSRSKGRIWVKGETSGNFLFLQKVLIDCDNDTLLIKANPVGPVCHTGADTCFDEKNTSGIAFLNRLSDIINDRHTNPTDESYTSSLFKKGKNKLAQKVGEEGVEVVIEAMAENEELLLNESADLIFHLMVLLESQGLKLSDVVNILEKRHQSS
ncbi:MAG: phosphoribosyl-ATP pyrophosphohydrolase/phosphoribosyl-AMP cyclohydrolase [Cyclobacteriaceae bacterium]|jgi:phosphoribosyl-ATP pyrophosphohydrolase/phosphoribosyl-AMP cyclohydrolase